MSIQRVYSEFEVLMRKMAETHECAHRNIEDVLRSLVKVTVNSCATMYGFSAQEALKRLNSDGEIIQEEAPTKISKQQQKEAEKLVKDLEKAEKLRLKEAEKLAKEAEKLEKDLEKAEKLKLKEAEKLAKEAEKLAKEAEKVNESSERSSMKDEDIASKAAEKLALKESKKAEKLALKKTKKEKKPVVVQSDDEESIASTVIMSSSEDEEIHILFQNIPLINEINSIRDVKKFKNWKKLSAGVKLARQILDI